jgi:hypothetical protein
MTNEDTLSPKETLQRQRVRAHNLRAAVYSQPDPASHPSFSELVQAEATLDNLEKDDLPPSEAQPQEAAISAQHGRLLGPLTTNLRVETKVHLQPLPTGIYHLLDPTTYPLFTVEVKNQSSEARRVRVTAFLEGLSARGVQTKEIERRGKEYFTLSPTLLPQRARTVTEIQWATLHIKVDILGSKKEDAPQTPTVCECHNTYPIACLARTSAIPGRSTVNHLISPILARKP